MKTHWKVLLAGILLWMPLVLVSIIKMQIAFDRVGVSLSDPADLAGQVNKAVVWAELGNIILIVSVVAAIYLWRKNRKRRMPQVRNH